MLTFAWSKINNLIRLLNKIQTVESLSPTQKWFASSPLCRVSEKKRHKKMKHWLSKSQISQTAVAGIFIIASLFCYNKSTYQTPSIAGNILVMFCLVSWDKPDNYLLSPLRENRHIKLKCNVFDFSLSMYENIHLSLPSSVMY